MQLVYPVSLYAVIAHGAGDAMLAVVHITTGNPVTCTGQPSQRLDMQACLTYVGMPYVSIVAALTVANTVTLSRKFMSSLESDDSLFVPIGTKYTDPGATAFDNVDGNLTSSLSTFGVGAVLTSKPTGTKYFTVTYTVQVG